MDERDKQVTALKRWVEEITSVKGWSIPVWAKQAKIHPGTLYRAIDPDHRTMTTVSTITKLATAAGVRFPNLSVHEPAIETVTIVGYVGASSEIFPMDDHAMGAGLEEIEAPPGCPPDAVAVIVRGDSQYPVYEEGDVLVYHRNGKTPEQYLHRRAIVHTPDGRTMVKRIERGKKDGYFTLTSHNAAPISDVHIEWVGEILWVRPNRR